MRTCHGRSLSIISGVPSTESAVEYNLELEILLNHPPHNFPTSYARMYRKFRFLVSCFWDAHMAQHTTAYTEDDFHARPRARLVRAGARLTVLPFSTGQPQSNPTPIKRARHAGYDPLHLSLRSLLCSTVSSSFSIHPPFTIRCITQKST